MKRTIQKVAVLGSGVMGSRIACHFANIGCEVLLLDIVPKEQAEGEKKSRNKIAQEALTFALKSNPSPIYHKKFASRIGIGNFEDDMPKIAACDWIIEVVVENLDIKKKIFTEVEKYRKPGTLISSNTSGIPIHLMTDGRSDDFKAHFCGTHFFNPPRYLRLLEIIPTKDTHPDVIDFLMQYGEQHLGKTTVLCKDTPAFIANRVGVYSIMSLFHIVEKMGLTVEEVDKLTGPVLGRPKSATFRTCDVVGLDTLVMVANGLKKGLPNDEANSIFSLTGYLEKMVGNKWFGDKTGQGFYKKVKNVEGKSEILALDLKTMEYHPQQKAKFATLEMTKTIDNLKDRLKVLVAGKDKAGEFYRATFAGLFQYVSNRIPEISDEIYRIDDALKAGFGWDLGPFEYWDAIGVKEAVALMEQSGNKPADWVYEMLKGNSSFYKVEGNIRKFYDIPSKTYKAVPGAETFIVLDNIRSTKIVWKNSGLTVTDIGDGILNAEFHTKMNTIGGEILGGLVKAVEIAEKDFRGLVISNEAPNFSAGANVGLIYMMAVEQDWDELDRAVRTFQNTTMRLRYSSIPVIAAPHGLALGGACEICLHADRVVAHAETYIGLVEFGVGLIPGGGGTKEFALRLSDSFHEGDIELNTFRDKFLTIGQAKVSTSAYEAFDLGILRKGIDKVVVSRNRLLTEAKAECLLMAEEGYSQPLPRKDVRVLGNSAMGLVYAGSDSMRSGNYISDHDKLISEKLGFVLAGGNLSQPTMVSEQYLLDLEREIFLQLCGERKTLERIHSIINGGRVLRN
ncbi:MAG: 3-hydroxyacyl-CoA dehydrogenase/enoyl-CoA hydratase family protein [Bacteroidetes bacterium]|jgi:3-hydroxyacyl-CoA dehydrogenase|nr:3-hydroxyacyl-CoA dehydrogenase/enoyl-CoA hydratase family protein [Bacteroidota bacterium]